MASVRLQGITKSFGRTAVIRGVDLEIADGEFVVFVGASGCGKSTLLRLVAGLEEPGSGEIWIGGERVTQVPPARRGVSMVFQSYALYPHMTVRENIAFGLRLAKTATETIDGRVSRVAAMLRIEPLLARRPRELSGGQRQRVAIARSIVREPRVFLFDEPLSNLDAGLRAQTRLEIARMHDDLGATMIYVTHDQVEAMTLADRIVLLNDGRIEQAGPPTELYERPANRYVASFLGSPGMNFVAVIADGAHVRGADGWAMPSPVPGHVGAATLGVRPEDLRLVEAGEGCSGRIVRVEELGETRIVHVALADGTLLAVRDRSEPRPRRGANVRIGFDVARAHLFDAQGRRIPPRG